MCALRLVMFAAQLWAAQLHTNFQTDWMCWTVPGDDVFAICRYVDTSGEYVVETDDNGASIIYTYTPPNMTYKVNND